VRQLLPGTQTQQREPENERDEQIEDDHVGGNHFLVDWHRVLPDFDLITKADGHHRVLPVLGCGRRDCALVHWKPALVELELAVSLPSTLQVKEGIELLFLLVGKGAPLAIAWVVGDLTLILVNKLVVFRGFLLQLGLRFAVDGALNRDLSEQIDGFKLPIRALQV